MIATQPSVTRASTRLPKMWVGYIFALAFLVIEVAEAFADPDGGVTLLDQAIVLSGWLYWLFCVRQLHEVLASATDGSYPITSNKAFGLPLHPLLQLLLGCQVAVRNGRIRQSQVTVSADVTLGWSICTGKHSVAHAGGWRARSGRHVLGRNLP
jgi:hypothetical protein